MENTQQTNAAPVTVTDVDPTTIVLNAWVNRPSDRDAYELRVCRYSRSRNGRRHQAEHLTFDEFGNPRWVAHEDFEPVPPVVLLSGVDIGRRTDGRELEALLRRFVPASVAAEVVIGNSHAA